MAADSRPGRDCRPEQESLSPASLPCRTAPWLCGRGAWPPGPCSNLVARSHRPRRQHPRTRDSALATSAADVNGTLPARATAGTARSRSRPCPRRRRRRRGARCRHRHHVRARRPHRRRERARPYGVHDRTATRRLSSTTTSRSRGTPFFPLRPPQKAELAAGSPHRGLPALLPYGEPNSSKAALRSAATLPASRPSMRWRGTKWTGSPSLNRANDGSEAGVSPK